MDNEFAKKVGREAFEKLSKSTQALILECSDHQKWLDTEQTKLDYIYSLAQRYPIYLKYGDTMAEEAEQKIQRAFQTLVIEGRSDNAANPTPVRNNRGSAASNGSASKNASKNGTNGKSPNNSSHSLEEDLEFSLEGL